MDVGRHLDGLWKLSWDQVCAKIDQTSIQKSMKKECDDLVDEAISNTEAAQTQICNNKIRAAISVLDAKDYKGGVLLTSKINIEIKNSEKPALSAQTLSLLFS